MRRARLAIVGAALLAVGLVAAPAQAGPGDPVGCMEEPSGGPTQNLVTVNGFDVTVNPAALPGDVDSAQDFGVAVFIATDSYISCVENDTSDPVTCRIPNVWAPDYVEQDPETGAITIQGNELVASLTPTCPPLL